MRPRRREDPAVGVERELQRAAHARGPAARTRKFSRRSSAHFTGRAELQRRERDQRRLDRQRALGAEAAADVGDDHADALLGAAEASARAARAGGARSATTSRPSAGRRRARRARRAAPSASPPGAGSRSRCARRGRRAANAPATSPARFSQRTSDSPARGSTIGVQRLVVDLDLLGEVLRLRARLRRPRPRPAGRRSAPRPSASSGCGTSARRPARAAGRSAAAHARPARSAAVNNSAPRTASRTRAWACGERTNAMCSVPSIADVVEELAAPGEQPRVLAATDRLAERAERLPRPGEVTTWERCHGVA